MAERDRVVAAVKAAGYRYVTLDLEGLRSGNLNDALGRFAPAVAAAAAAARPADCPCRLTCPSRSTTTPEPLADAIDGCHSGLGDRVRWNGSWPAGRLAMTPGDSGGPPPRPGHAAQAETGAAIRALLAADIDDQRSTPLTLLRQAVRYPTRVLQDAGVPPAARDRFAERAFPEDVYDLSPASLADVDPALTDPGISWGAAKAFEHKRRHRPRRG